MRQKPSSNAEVDYLSTLGQTIVPVEVKDTYLRFLSAVLWRLSGDREIFAEAMQYALMGMWEHVEKLEGPGAQSYIYRIALSANGKAWRDRVGCDQVMGGTSKAIAHSLYGYTAVLLGGNVVIM